MHLSEFLCMDQQLCAKLMVVGVKTLVSFFLSIFRYPCVCDSCCRFGRYRCNGTSEIHSGDKSQNFPNWRKILEPQQAKNTRVFHHGTPRGLHVCSITHFSIYGLSLSC